MKTIKLYADLWKKRADEASGPDREKIQYAYTAISRDMEIIACFAELIQQSDTGVPVPLAATHP